MWGMMPEQHLFAGPASQDAETLQEPQEPVEETRATQPADEYSMVETARHQAVQAARNVNAARSGKAAKGSRSKPTNANSRTRSTSRKTTRQPASPNDEPSSSTEAAEETQPKKSSRARKGTRSKQRSKPRSTQEHNKTAEPVAEARAEEAPAQDQDEHTFEPDLDVTPVKPRETEHNAEDSIFLKRESLFSDVVSHTETIEIELDTSPFEIEETLKRPAASKPTIIETEILIEERKEQEERSPLPQIVDTPLPVHDEPEEITEILEPGETPLVSLEEISIPETPPQAFELEDHSEAVEEEREHASSVAVMEKMDELRALEELEELEELEALEELETLDVSPVSRSPLDEIEIFQPETPLPPVEREPTPIAQPRRSRWQLTRGWAAALLLLALALCVIPLWSDIHDAHLYLYTINPFNGQISGQQDLGGGYASVSTLTDAEQSSSSLLVGLGSEQASQQRVLMLSGRSSTWNVSRALNAPTMHATLSLTPAHQLVVAYARGMQVLNADGSLLWQTSEDTPALGAHAFAPAFDATTLYTVNSAQGGVIVAYDLRDGSLRWTQRLGDTLNYAPPFLLYNNLLFVAGDHTLYALNSSNGQVMWKAPAPTRTLLITRAGLLVSVGAAGIRAFDPRSGQVEWAFDGHASSNSNAGESLTNAQFYEASLSNTDQEIFATGIVWDANEVRQQLWLFAIDASNGSLRWSEQTGIGLTGADAGRVLVPYADDARSQVLLEQAHANGSHTLTAYAFNDGRTRWSISLADVSAFAPTLFDSASSSIGLLSVQQDVGTALHSWSWLRALLFLLGSISLALLLLLWILPTNQWSKRTRHALRRAMRALRLPFALLTRRPARIAYSLVALLLIAGILSVNWIARPQPGITQVQGSNGQVQWQHALNTPATPVGADSLGSFVIQRTSASLSTLLALNADGSIRWSTFASEGQFSVPAITVEPNTVLVALSGLTQPRYHSAPDDIAYAHPLDSTYTLFLLDRLTGQIIWQYSVISGGTHQQTVVLGADGQNIYVASRLSPSATSAQQDVAVQLIAIDKATGSITWRVYGPRENAAAQPDFGALLSQGRLLYWQAANTVLALDTQLGQIEWRRYIAEQNPAGSINEEARMAQNGGVLLVTRSDQYHALDLITGNERWTIATPGSNTPQTAGGIVAVGHEFILYGNGAIEAIDATTHSVIWQHTDLSSVSNVMASPDGALVYALVLDNIDGGTPHQSLVAFDTADSAVRWTFQPSPQADFTWSGAPFLHFANGLLFVTACFPSGASACSTQALYGIHGTSGSVAWEFDASQVSQVQFSQDGSVIVLQANRSAWENLRAHFQG